MTFEHSARDNTHPMQTCSAVGSEIWSHNSTSLAAMHKLGHMGAVDLPETEIDLHLYAQGKCPERESLTFCELSAQGKATEKCLGKSEVANGAFTAHTSNDKENHWHSNSPNKDSIELTAVCDVPSAEFLRLNPNIEINSLTGHSKDRFKLWHATTGEVDAGWQFEGLNEDGTLRLSRPYSLTLRDQEEHRLVNALPGVPEEFTNKIEDKLKGVPQNVLDNLERAGYKIIAADHNSAAIPGLKDLRPRGWAEEDRFDDSDGTHDNIRRIIIAPMHVRGYRPGTWSDVSPERDNVVVHQIGHAIDFANGMLSSSDDFMAAYDRDFLASKQKNDKRFKYMSQPNGVGRQETFACIFGLLTTGPENADDMVFFRQNFPEVIKVVREQIEALK